MPCLVCIRDPEPKKIYCPRCWGLIRHKPDHVEHRDALSKCYDEELDAFICQITGVPLNDTDPHDPWYVTFHHLVPGKKGTMVIAAWWANDMIADMLEDEFRLAVTLFARHQRGEPVDWSQLKFTFWKRKPRPKMAFLFRERKVAVTPARCDICDQKPAPHSIYCPACRGFIFQGRNISERHKALKDGWDEKARKFRCHYTDAVLNITDPDSPMYLVFDHLTPGKTGRLVLTFAWINCMKMDLSEEEFLAIMAELDRHFRGAPFNKDVIRFEHWYRMVKPSG